MQAVDDLVEDGGYGKLRGTRHRWHCRELRVVRPAFQLDQIKNAATAALDSAVFDRGKEVGMITRRFFRSVCASMLFYMLSMAPAMAQVDAFRMSDLDLRDPHVFVNAFSCQDVTDTPLLGFSVNGQLQTSIQTDASSPADGLLDLSSLMLFQPLNQALASNAFDSGAADCTAPMGSTACSNFASSGLTGTATLVPSGSCLMAVAGSTHGYTPAITNTNGPCFVSPTGTILLDLGGIPVPLQDAQLAATFVGTPATNLVSGLMKGFLRQSDADVTLVPATFPLIGGKPISSLLPGGDPPGPNNTNCAAHSDLDVHNGESGWWFYLNFTAPRVTLGNDPFGAGFADGFED